MCAGHGALLHRCESYGQFYAEAKAGTKDHDEESNGNAEQRYAGQRGGIGARSVERQAVRRIGREASSRPDWASYSNTMPARYFLSHMGPYRAAR